MKKRIVPVVLGIMEKNDTYLLTQRAELDPEDKLFLKEQLWQLPGGGIEFGETPEQAIIREMQEELSVEIKSLQLINKVFIEMRGDWQGLFLSYICTPAQENFTITLNHESSDYRWFTLAEIRKLSLFPKNKEIIQAAVEFKAAYYNHS